jgi:RNA polymerase sigma-70 factor (ECF subfamily)
MTFETIYNKYWQKVYRLSMAYVNDHDWAKDIAQETFVSVYQNLVKFRKEADIGTWIYRIASNHCLRQIDKRSKMPTSEWPHQIEAAPISDLELKVELLYQYISELPETDRIIISLELENVKQAEIAEIVGISEANVRVKIFRIKEKLTQKFKQYEQ